jgi:hypothetical protein
MTQLPLLTIDEAASHQWHLDDRTRAVGLEGVRQAKAALRDALVDAVRREAA